MSVLPSCTPVPTTGAPTAYGCGCVPGAAVPALSPETQLVMTDGMDSAGRGSVGLCRRLDPGTALFLAAGVSLAALVGRTSFQKQSAWLLLLLLPLPLQNPGRREGGSLASSKLFAQGRAQR